MGLWHGATWPFVLWGVWHASLISTYRLFSPYVSGLSTAAQAIGGWLWSVPMVMIGWIPFRTQSIPDTLVMWHHLVTPSEWFGLNLCENNYLVAALVMLLVLIAPHGAKAFSKLAIRIPRVALGLHIAGMSYAILLVLVYLRPLKQFIYFQF